jgi:hypothetical protein
MYSWEILATVSRQIFKKSFVPMCRDVAYKKKFRIADTTKKFPYNTQVMVVSLMQQFIDMIIVSSI